MYIFAPLYFFLHQRCNKICTNLSHFCSPGLFLQMDPWECPLDPCPLVGCQSDRFCHKVQVVPCPCPYPCPCPFPSPWEVACFRPFGFQTQLGTHSSCSWISRCTCVISRINSVSSSIQVKRHQHQNWSDIYSQTQAYTSYILCM